MVLSKHFYEAIKIYNRARALSRGNVENIYRNDFHEKVTKIQISAPFLFGRFWPILIEFNF